MKHKCTACGHVDEIKAKNQIKGGKARWKNTTKKTRSAAASKSAKARWQKSENIQGQPRRAVDVATGED